MVNVPAASIRTSPAGQDAMALLICIESSLPLPRGLTVAQTVLRVGMPPTESIPAFFQFTETSFCGGKIVELEPPEADLRDAEHETVEPPLLPAQFQRHGPLPLTVDAA